MKWDIFCRIIDNYGDIGVTWRLARQLAAEHGLSVRLWVDEPAAFLKLCPEADPFMSGQVHHGVEIRHWLDPWPHCEAADVVIEAFACELPRDYVAAMSRSPRRLLWLNLEYLSAEAWVEGCHGLPSLQSGGLQKFFFFPGFTGATGGLLREQRLFEHRDAIQTVAGARGRTLEALAVPDVPGERLCSLFAYENPGLGDWLDALSCDTLPTRLLVPEGRILADLKHWVGNGLPAVGGIWSRDRLSVQVLPFLDQERFDRLLWCCDFNVVRGEDSFIRAQWAARPMLWHIYRQAEDAHLEKLEAFLARYTQGVPTPVAEALAALWRAWNLGRGLGEAWSRYSAVWPQVTRHALDWSRAQASHPDLAKALVQFYRNWL